jgi:hypothetical protein
MTAIATAAPRFEIGRVASRTFGTIGRNWLVFGSISLVLGAIPYGLLQWVQLGQVGAGAATNPLANWWIAPLGAFINLFSSCLIQASLVYGTVADLNGRRPTFGECLATGLRYMLPVLAISLLFGLGVGLGVILLIIPGVLMSLAWLVAVPVEVVERTGVFAAFGRSADLTRNHRGAIFGLMVVYFVIVWIVTLAIGGATLGVTYGVATATGGTKVAIAIFTAAFQSIVGMLGATGVASIYYELRSIKEGVGPEALASVFD